MDKQIVISIKTIFFAFIFAIALYIVYRLGNVIKLFSIALLVVFAIEPLVKKIMQGTFLNRNVSRSLAVGVSYTIFAAMVVIVVTIWLPPFIGESQKLIKNFPHIFNSIELGQNINLSFTDLVPQASQFSGNIVSAIVSIFSNLASVLSIFVLSLYMSLEWPLIKRRFAALFPGKTEDMIIDILDEIEVSIGNWIKGEAFLMFVVGLGCLIGLLLLRVSYPLSLALISGFLEVVPMIGPIASAMVAAIIALADAPVKALGVIALYILVQQLENHLLVPKVMQKVSGFSPLIILFALLAGSQFFGIAGAILAVPMAMIIAIVIKHIFKHLR